MRAFIIAVLLWPLTSFAINEEVMLDAIAAVETGNRDMVGAAGERGPYQLTPAVRSRVGGHDRAAAHRWLKIILRDMHRYHIDVNSFNVAMVYNGGITAVRRGRAAMSTYGYANRVSNTYSSRLVRALGRPQSKVPTPRFSLTPPMFTVPCSP